MGLVAIEIQKVNNTEIIYELLYVFTFFYSCNLDFVVRSPRTIKSFF